jgi:hypothetical protein
MYICRFSALHMLLRREYMLWLFLCCQPTKTDDSNINLKDIQDSSVPIEVIPEDSGDVSEVSDEQEPEPEPNCRPEPEDPEEGNELELQSVATMIFKATHNSYTGHEKGSIIEQLDEGVRSLELDFHDNDYLSLQSYQIGHSQAGSEVELGGGNPNRYHLQDWLGVIYEWSLEHPNHSLITVVLDIKDNLTDNHSYQEGNLAAINDLISNQFSSHLLQSHDWNMDLTVAETRGKIQVILSGDRETRKMYKRDKGNNPAVAVNDQGQVISVHESGQGTLWYWTGQINSSGTVEWKRHGLYDTGIAPAISINNEGWFVEVHQSESSNTLWSHVGYLDSDFEPIFFPSEEYDNGQSPTIAFVDLDGNQLKEIHNSASTFLNWDWEVTLNTNNATLNWIDNSQTNDVKFEKSLSQNSNYMIEVLTGVEKNAPSDTLLYSTNDVHRERIRYPQLVHIELQKDDPSELEDDETFFSATGSGDFSSIELWNTRGYLSRMWEFNSNHIGNEIMTFPATDEPMESWYQDYMDGIPSLE